MSKVKELLGPGFIATLAGIELTNIVTYMIIGKAMGFMSIAYISILFAASIYVQQVVTLFVSLKKHNFSRSSRYIFLIYISSNMILVVNLLVLSYIFYSIYSGSLIAYVLLFSVILSTLFRINNRRSINLLRALSLALILYIVGLVYVGIEGKTITGFTSNDAPSDFSDLLLLSALWGSITSPYSMIMQEEADTYKDLFVGLVFGVFISSSISMYAYLLGINISNISSLVYLPLYPDVSSKLILAGITASVFLAGTSIIYVNAKLTGKSNGIMSIQQSGTVFILLVIASAIVFAPILNSKLVDVDELIIVFSIYSSSLVGLLVSLAIAYLSFMCLKEFLVSRQKIWLVNFSSLAIISSIMVSATLYGLFLEVSL